MLDSIEPRQFDEWLASEELDPMFNPEVLYATLRIGFSAICHALMLDVTPEFFDPLVNDESKSQSQVASPNQAASMFRAMAGSQK